MANKINKTNKDMNVKEFNKLKAKGKVNGQGRLAFDTEAVTEGQLGRAENGGTEKAKIWQVLERDRAIKPKQHHEQHEEKMQIQILDMMEKVYPQYYRLLVHNANELKCSARQGAKRRNMGVKKGFPDLSFFVPSAYYHGLHIELKHGYNKQSEEQKMYQKLLEEQGYQYVVCKSVEDFFTGINQYLLLGRWG